MVSLDIRKESVSVDEIVFANKRELWLDATHIKPNISTVGTGVIVCIKGRSDIVLLPTRESVDNLIKSLEKAKEFGWV